MLFAKSSRPQLARSMLAHLRPSLSLNPGRMVIPRKLASLGGGSATAVLQPTPLPVRQTQHAEMQQPYAHLHYCLAPTPVAGPRQAGPACGAQPLQPKVRKPRHAATPLSYATMPSTRRCSGCGASASASSCASSAAASSSAALAA